jgi:isopenicillin N synthase-like dioxygenase
LVSADSQGSQRTPACYKPALCMPATLNCLARSCVVLCIALGAHTDSGGLTLLRTDMEGLQTFLDNEWHDVPVVKNGLVVNVARLLARWTNDRWTAAIHRVKNDGITTDRKLTLGMFT